MLREGIGSQPGASPRWQPAAAPPPPPPQPREGAGGPAPGPQKEAPPAERRRPVLTAETKQALAGNNISTVKEDFDESLMCSVCLNPAFGDGTWTKCDHLFHRVCLERALDMKKECPQCPQCRGALTMEDVQATKDLVGPAKYLVRRLGVLPVLCPQGCKATVEFDNLEDHIEKTCANTGFRCKHGACSEVVRRSDLAQHEAECPNRIVPCDCGMEMRYSLLEAHRKSECEMAHQTCRYCKREDIRRRDMSQHHSDECEAPALLRLQMAKMMTCMKQLSDEMHEMRAMNAALAGKLLASVNGDYELRLPQCIRALVAEASAGYERSFAHGWRVRLEVGGDEESKYVSALVGCDIDCRAAVKVRVGRTVHEVEETRYGLNVRQVPESLRVVSGMDDSMNGIYTIQPQSQSRHGQPVWRRGKEDYHVYSGSGTKKGGRGSSNHLIVCNARVDLKKGNNGRMDAGVIKPEDPFPDNIDGIRVMDDEWVPDYEASIALAEGSAHTGISPFFGPLRLPLEEVGDLSELEVSIQIVPPKDKEKVLGVFGLGPDPGSIREGPMPMSKRVFQLQ